MTEEKTYHLKRYDPADSRVLFTDNPNIAPCTIFTFQGEEWYALTGAVGYEVEIAPGIRIPAGMWQDPEDPEPDGAVDAVRVADVELVEA